MTVVKSEHKWPWYLITFLISDKMFTYPYFHATKQKYKTDSKNLIAKIHCCGKFCPYDQIFNQIRFSVLISCMTETFCA